MSRDPYCFIDGHDIEEDLELLLEFPIKVWACKNHPRSPYLTEGWTDD